MKVLNTYNGFSNGHTYESDAQEFDFNFNLADLKKDIREVNAESFCDGKWEFQSDWQCQVTDQALQAFLDKNWDYFGFDADDVKEMTQEEFRFEYELDALNMPVYLQLPMEKLGVFTDAEAWVCCQLDLIYTNQYGYWQEIKTEDWLALMKEARDNEAQELKARRTPVVESNTEMYKWAVRVAKDNGSSILKAAEYILSEHTGDNHHLLHVEFKDKFENGRLCYNMICKHAVDDGDTNVAGEYSCWLIAGYTAELYC